MKVILQLILIAYVLRITRIIGNSDELREYQKKCSRKTKYENKRLTN